MKSRYLVVEKYIEIEASSGNAVGQNYAVHDTKLFDDWAND